MAPTRELRDDLLQEFLGYPHICPCSGWGGHRPTRGTKCWRRASINNNKSTRRAKRWPSAKHFQEALDAMASALLDCNLGPEYGTPLRESSCAVVFVRPSASSLSTSVPKSDHREALRRPQGGVGAGAHLCTADAFAKLWRRSPGAMRFKFWRPPAWTRRGRTTAACCKGPQDSYLRWGTITRPSCRHGPADAAPAGAARASANPSRTTTPPRRLSPSQASVCQLRLAGSKRRCNSACS